jgi:zinc protease
MNQGKNGFIARPVVFTLIVVLGVVTATCALGKLPKKIEFEPIEFRVPHVDTLEFANGLTGYLIEDHDIPLVNIVIMYRTGFAPEDKTGLNNLAGWAIRNGGSLNFSRDVIDDELEFVGASIETQSGSYVGQITANFLTKDTDLVLSILADLITNPKFDTDKIELRRKSMIEGIRRKTDDPGALGRREFAKLIYQDHPAGREATVSTVSNIAREDVIEFHDKYVRPNNAVIGISGDMTSQETLEKLGARLEPWEPGGEEPVFPEMAYEVRSSVNYIYKDVNQAYIFAGHMGMNSLNNDRAVANLMNYVLGGGAFTSRITKRVRTDEGLAYGARSSYDPSPWGYGLFVASCQTKTSAAMRALGLIIEEIEKMQTDGPTEEEVSSAKESFINREVFDYESGRKIVNRMTWYDIVGLPLDTLERDFKAYQSAMLRDIREAATRHLHPEGLTILVVGNQELFDRPLSDFGQVNVIKVEEEEAKAP